MSALLPKFSNWQPLRLVEIKLKLLGINWILAGGFALELFFGKPYRSHEDIDIIIKRKHQNQQIHLVFFSRAFNEKPSKRNQIWFFVFCKV